MLIQSHYLKEFWKLFGLIAAGLALLMSVFQLLGKIENFLPNNPAYADLAMYTLLVMPRYLQYVMPMAALMAALFVTGQASKHRELTALMVAGGRMKRIFIPFVLTGLLLSMMGFVLGEIIVPETSEAARELKYKLENRQQMPVFYVDGALWLRAEDGSLVKLDLYVQETNTFHGVSIYAPDASEGSGRLGFITRARTAVYSPAEKAWHLRKVIRHAIATGTTERMEEMKLYGLSGPEFVAERMKEPYEMGIFEIKQQLDRLKSAGFKNLKLSVEMHSRLSFPFINLFLVVIGVAVAARRSLGGLKAVAMGIAVTVTYWLGFTMMLTMGYAAILPPLLAVWAMPVIFGGISGWLYSGITE